MHTYVNVFQLLHSAAFYLCFFRLILISCVSFIIYFFISVLGVLRCPESCYSYRRQSFWIDCKQWLTDIWLLILSQIRQKNQNYWNRNVIKVGLDKCVYVLALVARWQHLAMRWYFIITNVDSCSNSMWWRCALPCCFRPIFVLLKKLKKITITQVANLLSGVIQGSVIGPCFWFSSMTW